MNRLVIFILIVVSTSCRQNATKEHTKEADKPTLTEVYTTVINQENKSTSTGAIKPFVVYNTKDTLFIPETGKVLDINILGNSGYYYLFFESYKEETDFGKKTLVVRNLKNELLWKLDLEDYTQLVSNEDILLIIYYEKDLLEYYNIKNGLLKKSIKVNYKLSDGNDILITENNTYIKLINDKDGTTKDVMVINNFNFQKKMYNLNLNGYYSLRKDNGKVYIEGQNEKKYLDQLN